MFLQASKLAEKLNAEAAAKEAEAAEADGLAGSPRVTSSPGVGPYLMLTKMLTLSAIQCSLIKRTLRMTHV